jgi:hypothetical protein
MASPSSGYRCRPAVGIRLSAKQARADGFFNERERLLGLSCFGFSNFGAKLCGRQFILLGFNARLGLLKGSARLFQLMFGSDDELTLRPLGGLCSHFGKPQSFQGGRAKRPRAGFGLAGVLLHTAENIGRSIHQIQGYRSLVGCRRWGKA